MRCLTLFLVLVLGIAAAPPAQAQMKEFASREGRFSVLMPGMPTPSTEQLTLKGGGSSTVHEFTIEVGSEEVYFVMYNDYPPSYASIGPRQMLKNARDGALNGMTLLWDKEIALQGVPGRAFRARENKSGYIFESRFYVLGNRLYQLITASVAGKPDSPNRQAFLESFKITK